MRHLDVAGGTGDVAFRVLRALREAEAAPRPPASGLNGTTQPPRGSVVIADINPAMLMEGRKRAAGEGIGKREEEELRQGRAAPCCVEASYHYQGPCAVSHVGC